MDFRKCNSLLWSQCTSDALCRSRPPRPALSLLRCVLPAPLWPAALCVKRLMNARDPNAAAARFEELRPLSEACRNGGHVKPAQRYRLCSQWTLGGLTGTHAAPKWLRVGCACNPATVTAVDARRESVADGADFPESGVWSNYRLAGAFRCRFPSPESRQAVDILLRASLGACGSFW